MKSSSSSSSMSDEFQESLSKSTCEMVNGSHEFNIKGYSFLKRMPSQKCISSDVFQVGGYDWMVRFYPSGRNSKDNRTYVSVFIRLESRVDDVEAFVEFTLRDQSEKGNHKILSFFQSFQPTSWGYPTFIDRTTLENSGFLKDDCLVMSCTLGVVKHHSQKPKTVQIPPIVMGQNLKELMESGAGTDIAFEVGKETFRAHKLILAACSPVFKAQFFGLIGNKDIDKVLIKEVEPSVFKAMLLFMYSDELPLSTPTKMLQNLLVVADRFCLDRLKLLCESRLCEEVTTNTVATALVFAEKHHCSQLKTFCLKFVVEPGHLGEVMKSEGYEYLKASCPSLMLELSQTIDVRFGELNLLSSNTKKSTSKFLWDCLFPE